MAEKGGKGFSLSKGKTLSSSGKGGGKDTNLSSKKPKKRIPVSSSDSDSDSSPSPSPTPKGVKSNGVDYGKGGKPKPFPIPNDKTGKPQNAPKPLPETPIFNIEAELPKNAKCMMDCEALDALQKIQEHIVTLSEDPTIKLPESFHKGLQYAKLGGGYKSAEDVKRVLGMLKKSNVSESEICLIANICPDEAGEVFALMPKLKQTQKKTERGIEDVIRELVELKTLKEGEVGCMDVD